MRAVRGLAVAALVALVFLSACAGGDVDRARPLTEDEAGRLATMRLSAYRSGTVAFTASVLTGEATITVTGWIDTVDHHGYGLVSPPSGRPFLTLWDATTVSAQGFTGSAPPLPSPRSGWESTNLRSEDSTLAAAQLLLISLSSDRADNPQLLIGSGAQWQRSDSIDGDRVDVISGPVAEGTTVSNLRYWVDDQARLRKLEARLDGRWWSSVVFTPASTVTF